MEPFGCWRCWRVNSVLCARPKAAGDTIHCDAAVTHTFEIFESEPHNRAFRMWAHVLQDYAPKPGAELRRLKGLLLSLKFDNNFKLSAFIAALIKMYKQWKAVDITSDPLARGRLANSFCEKDCVMQILTMFGWQRLQECGLDDSLNKAYRSIAERY